MSKKEVWIFWEMRNVHNNSHSAERKGILHFLFVGDIKMRKI